MYTWLDPLHACTLHTLTFCININCKRVVNVCIDAARLVFILSSLHIYVSCYFENSIKSWPKQTCSWGYITCFEKWKIKHAYEEIACCSFVHSSNAQCASTYVEVFSSEKYYEPRILPQVMTIGFLTKLFRFRNVHWIYEFQIKAISMCHPIKTESHLENYIYAL